MICYINSIEGTLQGWNLDSLLKLVIKFFPVLQFPFCEMILWLVQRICKTLHGHKGAVLPFSPLEDTIQPVADWRLFPLGVLDFEQSTAVNRMQFAFEGLEILGFRGP